MPVQQPIYESWTDAITGALQEVWVEFATFLPKVLVAVIVFIIGWIIAVSIAKIVHELIKATRVDHLLGRLGAQAPLQRAGLRLDVGMFIGGIVKWFIALVFLLAASNILGLNEVSLFLRDVLNYIPNVFIAAVILLVSVMVANLLQRLVVSSVAATGLTSANFLGSVTKWSVMIFAVFAALVQLQIAPSLINTMFIGIIAMLAIAGGLAFGLGGKEHASAFITRLREEIAERR